MDAGGRKSRLPTFRRLTACAGCALLLTLLGLRVSPFLVGSPWVLPLPQPTSEESASGHQGASLDNTPLPGSSSTVPAAKKKVTDCSASEVAFVFAGLARTFEYPEVRDRLLENFVQALAGDCYKSFFVVTVQDDPSYIVQPMGSMFKVDKAVLRSLKKYKTVTAAFYHLNGELHYLYGTAPPGFKHVRLRFKPNRHCKVSPAKWRGMAPRDPIMRWGRAWTSVRAAYRMLADFEDERSEQFRFVVRLRPDFLSLEHLTPALMLQLNPRETAVLWTSEKLGPGAVNDHLVICPRMSCEPFFDVLSVYEQCKGGRLAFGRAGGQELLGSELRRQSLAVQKVELPLAILRPCPYGGVHTCRTIPRRFIRNCSEEASLICNEVAKREEIRDEALRQAEQEAFDNGTFFDLKGKYQERKDRWAERR